MQTTTTNPHARPFLCLNTWYGRAEHEVEIVGETPKRYRVRSLADGMMIPGGRRLNCGQEALVPKYAIKFVEPAQVVERIDDDNLETWE